MKQEKEMLSSSNNFFTEDDKRTIQLISGGLIGVNFLLIQGYISLVQLDSFERTAMDCFAATIPLLVVYAIAVNFPVAQSKSKWVKLLITLLFAIITVVNLFGIGSAFFHFSLEIGAFFFCSFGLALMLLAQVLMPIPRKKEDRLST